MQHPKGGGGRVLVAILKVVYELMGYFVVSTAPVNVEAPTGAMKRKDTIMENVWSST